MNGPTTTERTATDVVLRVQDLSVTYRLGLRHPLPAVAGVSLDIERGQTLALIGESGSGKSSIAKAICGLAPIESGTISIDGHDLTRARNRPAAAGDWGATIVFQDPVSAVDPRWPMWKTIAEPLLRRVGSADERRERALAMMERVGLDRSFGDRHPHQLSGGQRQRATIARALAPGPKLVILDEAVSALDVSVRNEVLVLLEDLKRQEGLTYLFISHDMGAVAQIATDVAVMYLGRVVESGRAERVIKEPAHPYTEALLAAVPTITAPQTDAAARLRGEIGDSGRPPPGCRFNPRCPLAAERCTAEEPQLRVVRERLTACHRAEEMSPAATARNGARTHVETQP
jgi:oligopeptide/dipeptide ABC transporter ATP-binding protein